MTDAERLEHARELVSNSASTCSRHGLDTLRWLISRTEAAQRCEELAAAWENLGAAASGIGDPANLYGFAAELREALGTADTD